MQIPFSKYEGAGNDFILVDNRAGIFTPDPRRIARLCDRHFGIGADGLMTLARSSELDCSMRYYNADGSEGAMCGNGARCFALFAQMLGIGGQTKYFDAPDGSHIAKMLQIQGTEAIIEIGMIAVSRIQTGDGWWFLNTGVPHYVEFTEELSEVDLLRRGAQIRHDTARFPMGTNVNFVEVIGPGELRMRTYERGVENETMACGTGATAAAIIANYALQPGVTNYKINVPGGELAVEFAHILGTQAYIDIHLTGAARQLFQGEFDTENF